MTIIECGGYIHPLFDTYRQANGTRIPEPVLAELAKKSKVYQIYQNKISNKYPQRKVMKSSILESLTVAEQKLLLMITDGMKIMQIAETQGRFEGAVRVMLHNIYNKIGANNLIDAVRIAMENNSKTYVSV